MSTRSLRRVTAAFLALLVVGRVSSAVGAQSASDTFAQVRAVDALDPAANSATFIYTGAAADATAATVALNGSDTPATVAPLSTKRLIANALVFDTSAPMDTSGALASAKEAARKWITARSNDRVYTEQFAIYAATDEGVVVQDFTADTGRLLAAIDRVGPPSTDEGRKKTALWSAVRQAALGPDGQERLPAQPGHHGGPERQRQRGPAGRRHRRDRQFPGHRVRRRLHRQRLQRRPDRVARATPTGAGPSR